MIAVKTELTTDPSAPATGHVLPPKQWVQNSADPSIVAALAKAVSVSERAARLLVGRGITDPAAALRFLNPDLKDLPDPSLMRGLDKAALRLADAIEKKHKIALYGDYDVDGVTSTSLLASFLHSLAIPARTYIPQRLREGYGLNPGAIETLAGEGIELLITLDCGITAADEITRGNERGIESIIVDHHRCPPELPPAFAVLNPHQEGCAYPDKGLAAVGVCFNLVVGVRRILRERGFFASRGIGEPNLRRLLDLVALGTIADMVPLTGVNRILTWYGIEELRAARRPGVRALMEVATVRPSRVSGGDVGFKLGPRINAAGRLADADVGVRMLLSTSMDEARPYAERLDHANSSRQRIEADCFEEAAAMVMAEPTVPAALVLYDEKWHPGVVGIVASKIVERFQRPAIIIGQGGRGSARTARGLHLYDAISSVSGHLRKFGGHRAAAGLTIDAAAIPAFRADLIARVEGDPGLFTGAAELFYDDEIGAEDLDHALWDEVERFAPFGNANPEPLFRMNPARIEGAKLIGKNHLKMRIRGNRGVQREAIAWKMGELEPQLYPGREIDVCLALERGEFSGLETLELRVKDLRLL
ncbi:MAG: single-stranded-DNA-specific exonuclease RecJ [Myxococcota bacterium]